MSFYTPSLSARKSSSINYAGNRLCVTTSVQQGYRQLP
jgi:hypothetical protein